MRATVQEETLDVASAPSMRLLLNENFPTRYLFLSFEWDDDQ